jgi:hypothetical protein
MRCGTVALLSVLSVALADSAAVSQVIEKQTLSLAAARAMSAAAQDAAKAKGVGGSSWSSTTAVT